MKELDDAIIAYEDYTIETLKKQVEKYRERLKKYDCDLRMSIRWTNDDYDSESKQRLPFGENYVCFAQFDFTHRGQLFLKDEYGQIEDHFYEITEIKKSWFRIRVCCSNDESAGIVFLRSRMNYVEKFVKEQGWGSYEEIKSLE